MSARFRLPAIATGAIVVLVVLALFEPTFASMVAIWNRDETFTHGYLIPALCGWLLWRDRRALAAEPIEPAYSVLWLIGGLLLAWLAADLVEVQVIRQFAATALIPTALWATLGTRWARRAMFPLLYLFFAVPFGDFLVPSLVHFTTEFTVAAVQAVGVPIYRDGAAFSLPSGNFEVVKACSGVRYLIATIALGTLFADLSYRSWKKRLWFMALCIVLPIVANGFRAFGIVMIANFTQMEYAVGIDHLIYGWIFFGVVMLLLFWLGGKFADPSTDQTEIAPAPSQSSSVAALVAVMAVLALAPAASFAIQSNLASEGSTAIQLRAAQDPWRGPGAFANEWKPKFLNEGLVASGRYSSSKGDVNVFARRYSSQAEGANEATAAQLISDHELGWRLDAEQRLVADGHWVNVAEIIGRVGEHWRSWRWYLVNEEIAQNAVHAKWLQLRSWLQGRPPEATIVCIAISMDDRRFTDALSADEALRSFAIAHGWRLLAESPR